MFCNFSLQLNMANRRHVVLVLWPRKWRNILNKRKGGSENLYTSKPTGAGGLLKNWAASEGGGGGATKISSFEFQYLPPHPPLVMLNELSLTFKRWFGRPLFLGKFCDASCFFNLFFYWHEAMRAEKRKPLVKTVGILTFMPSVFDSLFWLEDIFNCSTSHMVGWMWLVKRKWHLWQLSSAEPAWNWDSQRSWPEVFFSLDLAPRSALRVANFQIKKR